MSPSTKSKATSVRSIILTQMHKIAKEHKCTLMPLTDDLAILESGLDSICIAVLVARLEDELKVDPLSGQNVHFPVSLHEFILLYEQAAQYHG